MARVAIEEGTSERVCLKLWVARLVTKAAAVVAKAAVTAKAAVMAKAAAVMAEAAAVTERAAAVTVPAIVAAKMLGIAEVPDKVLTDGCAQATETMILVVYS